MCSEESVTYLIGTDLLLITPESMESQFINHDRSLRRLYQYLRFVVIDELHAFLDNVRGIHLRSLLTRLSIASGCEPRCLGLSATIGDFAPAQAFLCPDHPDGVRVIEDPSQRKELRVGIKAYLQVNAPSEDNAGPGCAERTLPGGLTAIATDVALRFRSGSNLIFCNSRRQTELLADQLQQIADREVWGRNPFLLHHGSLSRELREDAERELKSGSPVSAICTSTLEMGIDIGSVRAVGQVGPTWSVAAMVQRLGRSGRKEGEAQVLRLYTLDVPLRADSSLEERLHPELIRAIALLELHREKWLEPSETERYHFSTCAHQVFSVLRQTGGATAAHLHDVLCRRGAFRKIKPAQFAALLRGLATHALIEQVPTGELILAPGGERIVETYEFYAAFASRIEYSVECGGDRIGVLPVDSIPDQGEFLLLAGRRWHVDLIDQASRRVIVSPARGWKEPRFSGGIGGIHPKVMEKMRAVLSGNDHFSYLHSSGEEFLAAARSRFRDSSLEQVSALEVGQSIEWFPWAGTNVMLTLELCGKADGLDVRRGGLHLHYQNCSLSEFRAHCERVAQGRFSPESLVVHVHDLQRDRFDEYIPESLLQAAFIDEVLALRAAEAAARSLLLQL